MRRRWALRAASCLVLVSALSGSALGATSSSAPAPAGDAATLTASSLGSHDLGRPIFLGLIAAVFLVLGATVGANDHPDARAEQRH